MKLKTVFFVFLGAILCANCVAEEILEVRLSSIAVEGGRINGFSADARSELEKDEEVLKAALATPGLSADELRRVRAWSKLPRHAILTRRFRLSFDSENTGVMADDFVGKGIMLMDFRINELKDAITPVNWGGTFRLYPFEVKYWRQKPLRKELKKRFPEMGYAG